MSYDYDLEKSLKETTSECQTQRFYHVACIRWLNK